MRFFVLIFVVSLGCSTKQATAPTSPDVDATPAASTDASTEKSALDGKELYAQVCVTCHGKTGDGQGLEQQLFGFGADATRWKNGPTIDGIAKTLQDGIHETSMKPFDWSDEEKTAVARYVLVLRSELAPPASAP